MLRKMDLCSIIKMSFLDGGILQIKGSIEQLIDSSPRKGQGLAKIVYFQATRLCSR